MTAGDGLSGGGTSGAVTLDLDAQAQNRLNAVPGLEAKTADLSIEETGRTWSEVAAVADGGFATHANANTLSSAQAEALTYSASRNATGTDAGRFYTLLRIPSGEDVRDFRVVQTGDLGTFTITNWHTIGTTTTGFTYAYSQHNLFEGYAITVEQETSTTTTHFRGEADAENVGVDASGFGTNLGSGDTDVQTALDTLDGLTLGADPIAEFSSRAYSRGELCFTGTGTAFTVWVADQAIGANSTEPTRAHPRNWLPVAGPGAIRGLLSDINTNVLRRGDIFWLEELNDPQKVYFTRTAGTYTTEADLTDPDNVIELTDGADAVSDHNTSGTAHNDIRSDVSTVEDRLDALDGVEIEPYDSSATYSRGSANSIVTHSSGLFVYISSTERSSGHDPDTQPGYWLKLSEGVAYEVITSGSHRIAARTVIVDGNNDNVYLCTTTQTTPRDLTHIAEQAAATGGTFILLNGAGSGGTTVSANPSGTDGDDLTRVAIAGTNYNIPGGSGGSVVNTTLATGTFAASDTEDGTEFTLDHDVTDFSGGWLEIVVSGYIPAYARYDLLLASRATAQADAPVAADIPDAAVELALGRESSDIGGTGASSLYIYRSDEDNKVWISVPGNRHLGDAFTLRHVSDGGGADLAVQEEGTEVASAATSLNFTGSGATATASNGTVTVDIPGGSGGAITGADVAAVYQEVQLASAATYDSNANHITLTVAIHPLQGDVLSFAVPDYGSDTGIVSLRTNNGSTNSGARDIHDSDGNTFDIEDLTIGRIIHAQLHASNWVLLDGALDTTLADGSVTTAKLADDAVTGAKIADDTIHGGALIDGTIATIKIGDSQVTGAKLSSNAVSTGKVADDAITSAKIAAGAVGSGDIASSAVTAAKIASNAVTTAKVADDAITAAKLADDAAGEGKVPIDNTLQFDGSGDLGVQITTVTELLSEDIRYYSTDTTREDAHQASKGVVFLDTSRFAKKIHSIEWDFEGDGIGNNYATFIVGIDSSDDISHIYGQSDVLFNVTTSGTHRTTFGTEGVRVPGGVTRLGVFLVRTGSPADATHETKVYRGQPADDSPRESYPSASLDFPFWRSARFDSSRPEIGEHIDNYITNGEIYGYPKIRYSIEVEHTPFVGDGSVSASHISSGSSADGTVLTADGSGGVAFEAGGLTESEVDARVTAGVLDFAETGNTDDVPLSKIPGGVTHIESGATYNNNVITVSTAETVRGGDGILFAVPTPFGSSSTQAVSLAIDGQSNSEHPLHDRNGDALHEDDLTANSVYVAISDADSWDILVLPAGSAGSGISQSDADDRYARQSENLSDLDSAATARTNLGLGSAAQQPASAFLTTDSGDSRYLNEASNLSDLPNASTARTNLGLGTAATAADSRLIPDGGTDGQVLTKASGTDYDAEWEDAASGGGGSGGGVSIGDSIGTYRLVNSYTTNRMYASTVPVPAAADGDLLVITFAPDDSSPDNAIGGSEIAFVPLANVVAIPNAYTGSSAADTEGSDRDGLRTGFGQNDWLYLGVTALTGGNLTIGSTDAKYAGVFTFRILTYGTASESGEESPGSEGVAEKTPDLVTVVLWQWFEDAVTPIPDNPGAHWRFDDEWDGTTPESSDGGGWFTSRGAALDDANLNPDFSQSSWTLWIATEQVRRRVVNDEYSYTDGGYSLLSVFDDQYSANSSGPWSTTYDEDTHNWMRMRNSIGEYTPAIAIGNSLEVSWETFLDAAAIYQRGPQDDDEDEHTFSPAVDISGYDAILLQMRSFDTNNTDGAHDFTNLGEIILSKPPGGWPVTSAENNWITADTYQYIYDGREANVLRCFLIGDGQFTNLVDSDDAITSQTFTGPGIPNSVRDATKQHWLATAGRFKFIGTAETNVTKIRQFDNPENNSAYNRLRWYMSGLKRG